MRLNAAGLVAIAGAVLMSATAAQAQERPAPIVEAVIADAAFVDEVWDHFFLVGGGARVYVTPRLALGGEVAYMRGDAQAANTTVLGTLTFDLRPKDAGRVTPYVVVVGGVIRQRTLVGTGPGGPPVLVPFIDWEGTVGGGIGARIKLGSRLFVAPEFQFGWAPTTRLAIKIGVH